MTEPEYINAVEERERAIMELDRMFDENGIEVLLYESFSKIAPFTGFPSMTVPIGQRADNMPLDSYWVARRYDEASLLKITFALEQLMGLNLHPEV